jgi:LCP family protein required for cell wall assembly
MKQINYSYKKPKKRKATKIFKKGFLGLLLFCLFTGIFSLTYAFANSSKNGISFQDTVQNTVVGGVEIVNEVWEPSVPKFQDRFLSVLIVGVDAHFPYIEDGIYKDEKQGMNLNTDTMMQVVYDFETNRIFMVSIPRDSGLEYEDECLQPYENFHVRRSVNHIYKFGNMGECPGGGIEMLKEYLPKITGIPIHYHVIVNLESYVDIVDVLGETNEKGEKGLWIDVPERLVSYYPNARYSYDFVEFNAGNQFLTSFELLQYSRVRQNSNDFERARRQQLVMETLKEKVMNSDNLKNANTILQLMNSFEGKVIHNEIGLDEIRLALDKSNEVKDAEVYHIVLDDQFGGLNKYLTRPTYSSGKHTNYRYYLIPIDWDQPGYEDDWYKDVKTHLMELINNPELIEEDR